MSFLKLKRQAYCKLSLLTVSIMVAVASFAQLPDPGDDDGDPDTADPAPIDGGISLLAVAAIAYGAKKTV